MSEHGRRETEAVAAYVARLGINVYQIRYSDKTRAEQRLYLPYPSVFPAWTQRPNIARDFSIASWVYVGNASKMDSRSNTNGGHVPIEC